MTFSDQFLGALGAWQNGWGTDQTRRKHLGSDLLLASKKSLPSQFKTANGQTCYRKRFIHEGELKEVFVDDAFDENVASWTFNLEFARKFRGLKSYDEGAITAAVFKCNPADEDVVVNIPALWKDVTFVATAESYLKRTGPFARALFNFQEQNDQEEIVLTASLRGSSIIAVSAPVKTFDEYCDMMGLPNDHRRDVLFRLATEHGMAFGDMQYLTSERTAQVSASAALTGHLVNTFNEILASS